jgi:adenylosuccinate synthase
MISVPPLIVDRFSDCEPVYVEMPGWNDSTVGITKLDQLPEAARNYLRRLEEILEVPVHIVSTGADRNQNILIRHPFDLI